MNKIVLLTLILALPALPVGATPATPAAAPAPVVAVTPVATPNATAAPDLREDQAMMSYASGVATVRNFTRNSLPFDVELMIRGMRDVIAGGKLAASEKEMSQALSQLQTQLRRNQAVNRRMLSEQNGKRGAEHLAALKKQEGVTALPNGVLYRVLKAGNGDKPVETDSVIVNYRGTKLDGTEFDASAEGKPATLRMAQTIMGWREALKQMPVGSRWQVVIPPPLAYGDRGVGEVIGPNETLQFDVELVGIKPGVKY